MSNETHSEDIKIASSILDSTEQVAKSFGLVVDGHKQIGRLMSSLLELVPTDAINGLGNAELLDRGALAKKLQKSEENGLGRHDYVNTYLYITDEFTGKSYYINFSYDERKSDDGSIQYWSQIESREIIGRNDMNIPQSSTDRIQFNTRVGVRDLDTSVAYEAEILRPSERKGIPERTKTLKDPKLLDSVLASIVLGVSSNLEEGIAKIDKNKISITNTFGLFDIK